MQVSIGKKATKVGLEDYSFFLEYIKIMGMVLFAISLTTPVLIMIVMDVDIEVTGGHGNLIKQLIWDKPILPYIAGFIILIIQWFKFVEVNHYLKSTDLKHILITMGFFFFLSLYPFFEMNIEFTSGQPHARALFSAAWGMLGIFQFWQLHYAQHVGLIENSMSENRINSVKREILADPAVALVCVGLSYTNLLVWVAAMIVLVPVMNYIMARIRINREK